MIKKYVSSILAIGMCLTLISGCGNVDELARQKQAKSMLDSFRKNVDLNGRRIPDVEVGQNAPATAGIDVEGQTINLSDHSGKTILLTFWGGG